MSWWRIVLSLVGGSQPAMMLMAGIFLVLGAVSVKCIKIHNK